MKENIRVIKHIGTLTSGEGNWQKELNVVTINNGPFVYDLREWSLDHTAHRNGLSFGDQEAQVLLAILKECFKDGEESISIEQFPDSIIPNKTNQSNEETNAAISEECSDEKLFMLLKNQGVEFTDKRANGGSLWIVGGQELEGVVDACNELGYKFFFSEKGGKVTKKKPGWYLPAKQ